MAPVKFTRPEKKIFNSFDLGFFHRSLAYKRLHLVILVILNKIKATDVPKGWLVLSIVTRQKEAISISGTKLDLQQQTRDDARLTDSVEKVIAILDKCNLLIDETPLHEGPRRFGNLARRDWHDKLEANAGSWLKELTSNEGLNEELAYYLLNSFGSAIRLDYGSGHELSFVAFVGGLMECGILERDVLGPHLLAIFARYYDIARRLIIVYNLEPAGSHGVWGLDDHFHFIYILGAAQFNLPDDKKGSQYVPPVLQILKPQIIDGYKESNLYVNAIAFIFKIKLGPFYEHSPIINDIHHSVSLWTKVLSGLIKMYDVEVFDKVPVVQHFWFGGGLYPWKDADTLEDLPSSAAEVGQDDSDSSDATVPGLINGFTGTKTTKSNITLTGAPWARGGTQQDFSRMKAPKSAITSLNNARKTT